MSSEQTAPLPPVVYVPCQSPVIEPDDEVVVEMRHLIDGRLVLPVYSSLDRLTDHCGEQQPWLLVESGKLAELAPLARFEAVALDMDIPQDWWHGSDGPTNGQDGSHNEEAS